MSRRLLIQTESDNEDGDHVRSALPISKSKAELVNGQPVSGEDYLLMVRDQANRCPKTVTAAPPPITKKTSLPAAFAFFQEQDTVPDYLLPDPAWQQAFADSFKSYQSHRQRNKPKHKVTLPVNWRQYCYEVEPDQERLGMVAHCSQVTYRS
ncbi:hypothetical protein BJV82DRAFT_88328 [Fennellomyces sp. T-0311]|nr:hypothetical protein BJV82DRAFT_88328 [Fennellomyces sp. T-0311]